jgi:hypothetical protein
MFFYTLMYLLKNTLMNKDRFLQLLESKLGNVKPLLNETYVNYAGQTQNVGTVDPYGGMAKVDTKNGTVTLNIQVDFEAQEDGGWPEMRLSKGTTFKKQNNGTLVSSNQTYQLVSDTTGDDRGTFTSPAITYYCKSKNLDIKGRKDEYKQANLFWNENWPRVEKAFQDLCVAKIVPPKPVVAQASKTQCDEYKSRQTTPVTANAGDIQTFLKNIGYNIAIDYAFGDGTATALGNFMYGSKPGINSVATLWEKMKASSLDVGTTPGFGLKMATAAANWINTAIPKLVKTKCATVK